MGEDHPVRIGIIAADPLRALGLETILQASGGCSAVMCDLGSALADLSLAALLLDDHSDGDGVLPILAELRRARPDLKLLVLGEAPDLEYIRTVIAAGARGYLLETTSEADVRLAVDTILKGSVWAPRKVLARLDTQRSFSRELGSDTASVAPAMTPRERQVLDLLIDGSTNREIGKVLGIDEVTVKAHLGRMLRKTGSKNRVELTLRALEERATEKREMNRSGLAGAKGRS